METEIRDYGDSKTIVVYTTDKQIADRIKAWKECFKVVPYHQDAMKREVVVGVDLYLPKRLEPRARRLIFKGISDRAESPQSKSGR